MTWQDIAALIGAIGGTIGAVAGVVVYLQSGSRVKVRITLGVRVPGMMPGPGQIGLIVIDPKKFSGSFGYGIDFNYAELVVIVEARNVGRLAVNLESVHLTRGGVQLGGGNLFTGAHSFPHRLNFGSSATWTAPFEDAYRLAHLSTKRLPNPSSIGAAIQLGNGKEVQAPSQITPLHMQRVLSSWQGVVQQ